MCEIHLLRWLLLPLLDDLLNGPNEEVIHVVSPLVGESHQQSCNAWKSSWTHKTVSFGVFFILVWEAKIIIMSLIKLEVTIVYL